MSCSYKQPQFVKFNNNAELPETVQNKYFLYYVVSGIDSKSIPAIYVNLESIGKLDKFINTVINHTDAVYSGTNTFVNGEDYFVNKSLYELSHTNTGSDDFAELYFSAQYLSESYDDVTDNYLPNFIENGQINIEYFSDITLFDDYIDIFIKQNELLALTFTEEELNNFYSTFCSLILEYTEYEPVEQIDFIYEAVLNFYANMQNDKVYFGMNLVLGSLYAVASTSSVTCGCSGNGSGDGSDAVCSKSCIEYYKQAMLNYLIQMLGDYTFYQKWFYITDDEGASIPNDGLIDTLKKFINEFLSLGYNLSFGTSYSDCNCPAVDTSGDACNRGIINNYLQVLDWVKNDEIEENANKIKIYGQQFAQLLPYLQF